MKKILVIAAAALAFAACTKSEVFAPAAAEIDFTPNALTTKALILPDSNSPEQLAFPTGESFNVFAFADLDGTESQYVTNYGQPLMNDVNISYQNGDWKATPVLDPVTGENKVYLWPATGTVDFYAYYPGTLTAVFDSLSNPKHLKLSGISLGTAVGSQIDPLVASTLGQIAKNKPKVGVVFKHITSQIAATAYDATTTKSLRGKISIEKVVFKNMKTSGDYTEGTTVGKGAWDNINTVTNFTSFQGREVLDTLESYLSAGAFSASLDNNAAFVIVPETVVDTLTANYQAIEVTYSIAAYTINGFNYPATPSRTIEIPLYDKIFNTTNNNKIVDNTFKNGKRYVFHLGLSLDGANNEIMFAPKVEGWETEDIDGITIDVINSKDGEKATLL